MRHLLLLCLLLVLPAWSHDAPKQDPPRYPTTPPPLRTAASPGPAPAGRKVWRYSLQPGWNMVSFPVARVTWVNGLKYQLMTPAGVTLEPQEADTSRGYWVYACCPETLEIAGDPCTGNGVLSLDQGWNLVGCPSEQAINFRQLSLGAPPITVEQAIDVEPCWIFGYAYLHGNKKFALQNLEDPNASLTPQQATWIYARNAVAVSLNLQRPAPVITSVVRDGDDVVVTGTNLGSPAGTQLYFAEHAVPTSKVLSWTPTQIRASGPSSSVNGTLVVMSQGRPSNRFPVQLGPPPTQAKTGCLSGQVTNDSNEPVAGARIQLDTGAVTWSDESGAFSFSTLTPGPHSMTASAPGHGGAQGTVTVVGGVVKPVAIMLPLRRGAISVRAYPFPYGSANFQPVQILMWETGDYHHRYLRDYSSYERGWPRYDLNWSELPMGREYSVTVTWQDGAGNQQQITHRDTLDRSDFVDWFYNSWSY